MVPSIMLIVLRGPWPGSDLNLNGISHLEEKNNWELLSIKVHENTCHAKNRRAFLVRNWENSPKPKMLN